MRLSYIKKNTPHHIEISIYEYKKIRAGLILSVTTFVLASTAFAAEHVQYQQQKPQQHHSNHTKAQPKTKHIPTKSHHRPHHAQSVKKIDTSKI
ncbi:MULTISPECIES: hypothetical protein [unclassified Acinetobacter]|uniref:hypothetical protein n=1 Tax=unclassified Acinetobacter TaxID=196816 RepID=UPI00293446C1|nr:MULTISPECIES: hypothetical protein [unclassified Acinetobacter]WOE30362.1 hypothetical protein QSG84_07990 [Acinetobacter sp. SAAs470]WOE38553.1 hypothetical protein QSG86_01655 [Acinetobacter sp. SAAs474]